MRSSRSQPDDSGMVTAELAACLPVLVLVLGMAMAVLAVAGARMRATDAAREAARVAARADGTDGTEATCATGVTGVTVARRLVAQIAPGGRLSLTHSGDETVAVVRLAVHPLSRGLPSVTVVARAVAATEPAPLGSSP